MDVVDYSVGAKVTLFKDPTEYPLLGISYGLEANRVLPPSFL